MLSHRINRATYWLGMVIFVILMAVIAYSGRLNGGMEIAMILLGVPRLHDIGRSGWIALGVIGAEVAIVFGSLFAGVDVEMLQIIGGILALVIAGLAIWLGVIPGDLNANEWGAPPEPGVKFRNRRADNPAQSQ